MTQKACSFLFSLIAIFICSPGFGESLNLLDSKVILLSFPEEVNTEWKELQHVIQNCKDAIIELIPKNQKFEKWKDLITIQTLGRPEMSDQLPYTLEEYLKTTKEIALSSYPGSKVTWDVIEEHENEAIYEWRLHNKFKSISPQHDISRIFVTDSAIYRIAFTKKGKMSPEERKLWINVLKQNVTMIDAREAINSPGISMVGWLKESIIPTGKFEDWQPISSFQFSNGYRVTCFTPPSLKVGGYVDECLEVISMQLGPNPFTLEDSCRIEIESNNAHTHRLLDKTDSEIIFYYSHPKDNLLANTVVRTILQGRDLSSFRYVHGLKNEITKEEMLSLSDAIKRLEHQRP